MLDRKAALSLALIASLPASAGAQACMTEAVNVTPGDTPNSQDVFVLDRTKGLAERANIDSSGQPRAGADRPAISADGRFVVFTTGVAMEPADLNTGLDVYLRDRLLGTTRLASTTPDGGAGIVFGDGLVCVYDNVIRLGTRSTSNGTSRYPGPGDASVSVRGQVPASGAVRHYQTWCRIAAPFCTPATFSSSNAVTIAWAP